ncbi:transient receptor potential cation channel subfamily A member 1 homolog [Anabrus simplex]|uniref:transient receptor potential cation channel subfamily A member 1 homolog n=1 Tax=Anabrus simplex TaxID=316456 RepID=UPI0035A389F3
MGREGSEILRILKRYQGRARAQGLKAFISGQRLLVSNGNWRRSWTVAELKVMEEHLKEEDPGTRTYKKRPGICSLDGPYFEIKMDALVFLRAVQYRSLFTNFRLETNRPDAGYFADLVFSYGSPGNEQIIMVQFTYSRRADVKLKRRVKSDDSPAKTLLCTTLEPEDVCQVDLTDDVCKDIKLRDKRGAEAFANSLLIFRNQSGLEELDELIRKELKKISNGHERQSRIVQQTLFEKMRASWEKPVGSPIRADWEDWTELKMLLLDPQAEWLKAMDEGDLTTFENMLRHDRVDPLYRYPERGTCLEIACSQPNRGEFVRALLKKIKPSVNTFIPEPIHYAAKEGADDAMAELLSHKQTDVNAVTNEGETPLHYLAKYYEPDKRYRRCLKLLLEHPDIDINKANNDGYTIIHQAAKNKNQEMVEEILLNCRNELDLDSQYGHGETARIFLTKTYPDLVPAFPSKKSKLYSAYSKQLLYAFNNRQKDIFRGLLQQVDEDGDAVFDPNFRYGKPYNETCLEMACRQKDCGFFIEVLLEAGADPNQTTPNTNTAPIHVAAEALNYKALDILLNNESTNANAVDNRGCTALDYAANSPALKVPSPSNSQDNLPEEMEEKLEHFRNCAELLNNRNVIPVKGVIDKNSPISQKVVDILEGLTEISNEDVISELREHLHKKQADDFITKFHNCLINELDPHKHTFLQLAIENRLTKVVSELLNNNTDPNKVPDKGTPTLIMAVKQQDTAILKLLLDVHGIDVDIADRKGDTALHHAVRLQNLDIMKLLLSDTGIDVDIADRKGDTALHHAVRLQNLDIIKALLNHGADIAQENVLGRTPLPASSLQTLLDKSLKTNDNFYPGSQDYEVIFDYTLLTASKTESQRTARPSGQTESEGTALLTANQSESEGTAGTSGQTKSEGTALLTANQSESEGTAGTSGQTESEGTALLTANQSESEGTAGTSGQTESEGTALLTANQSESEGTAGTSGQGSVTIHMYCNQQQNQTVPALKAETEILHYISKHREQYKHLLNHPVISSFLNFKWDCVSYFFYINFGFYVIFFIILNSYIICSPTPNVGPEVNNSPPMNCYFIGPSVTEIISEYRNSTRKFSERKCYQLIKNQYLNESANHENVLNCSEVMNHCLGAESSKFIDVTQTAVEYADKCVGLLAFLVFFTGILVFRELLQIFTCGWSYLKNIENYLDIGIVSITITIMSLQTNDPYIESYRVFAILLSSCELILLLGREPFFSYNIEMLKTVTGSYMKLFLTFLAIILAFAHCLHIVFRQDMNKEGVHSVLWTICRTVVFMTGEYEADDLHFSSMPITSITVFLLFIFFISIVLLNLLIGLSVNNTKMIEERSEVVCITSKIDLIYGIENMMLRFHNCVKCLNRLTESVILFPKADEDKVVIALQNKDGELKENPIDKSVFRKGMYSRLSTLREIFRDKCCLICRKCRKCRKCRGEGNPKIDKNILENALKIISSNYQTKMSSNEGKN